MARTDGGGTRRRSPAAALEAGREHLEGGAAGDDGKGAAGKAAENQGATGASAGDKAGEEGRREFIIPEDRRDQLASARDLDKEEEAGRIHEDAFWAQICANLGANSATVQPAEDATETGIFTAWPREEAAAEFSPATNEEDHSAALNRFEAIVEGGALDLATLGGDTRDIMLDIFRNRHKPWSAMSPSEQRDVASSIALAVQATVSRIVQAVAAGGRSAIKAQLERYADKGGEITATVKIVAAEDKTVLALHRASGKTVMIVVADADSFMGQRREAVEREDPELGFDAGDDRAAAPAGDTDLANGTALEGEELYAAAVKAIRDSGNASVSFLERELSVTFPVADGLIDRMEKEGVVSAPDVTTKRTVLPFEPAANSGEDGGNSKAAAPASAESA